VAPAKDYIDKVTKKLTAGIRTGQIYWGAVPFVIIQIIMIGLVIAFPQMVLVYKSKEAAVNPSEIHIEIPSGEAPGQAPSEQQEQKQENEEAQSLEKAFQTPPAPEPKK
jgi:hypothetical protein